jgi:hypothetical protein
MAGWSAVCTKSRSSEANLLDPPPIKRLYEALGLSLDRSRRHEVETMTAATSTKVPFCRLGTRGDRLRSHHNIVCFGLCVVVE